jgi:glutamate-1-semialdehyde 2,1-aminomutase
MYSVTMVRPSDKVSTSEQLLELIPGGGHTYSRGNDQFPQNAPSSISRGRRQFFWDDRNQRFLDFGMGLRSVGLGHVYRPQLLRVIWSMRKGNSFSRPSNTELTAAKIFLDLFDNPMMVKFAKNGSNVTTAAVKLARAYTGRNLVCIPSQQPFFSFDDWFIGSTPMNRGTVSEENKFILKFDYGNLDSLKKLFAQNPDQIAAVILEPFTPDSFCTNCQSILSVEDLKKCKQCIYNFLCEVQALCHANGALLIMDEMITGFRVGFPSVSQTLGLDPDLITFGKAISNGFSVAALVGRPAIMSIAGISNKSEERVFLLSSTNGAESVALEALISTVQIYNSKNVTGFHFSYGRKIAEIILQGLEKNSVAHLVTLQGIPPLLNMAWKGDANFSAQYYRTLFNQEMFKCGVFMPWIAPSYSHNKRDLKRLGKALDIAFQVCNFQSQNPDERLLIGQEAKPVFRKFN